MVRASSFTLLVISLANIGAQADGAHSVLSSALAYLYTLPVQLFDTWVTWPVVIIFVVGLVGTAIFEKMLERYL